MSDNTSRPLDEQYDTQMEVERDPCGAWMAIQSLAARLEKAEAERDAFKELAERQLGQMIEKAAQARKDALEEAEHSLDAACEATGGHFVVARDKIRALKSQPDPTTPGASETFT